MKKWTLALLAWCMALPVMAGNTIAVTFTHDGLSLSGRLETPAQGNGPFPLIILAPGSGANDKNATLPMQGSNIVCLYPNLLGDTLHPYRDLSKALSDSGYAVFTYDKVEYTYPNPGVITFHKLWMPVESALTYLKTRSEVDVNQIILLGHSEGSGIIPYITQQHPEVKALISLAGPITPFDSLLAYQINYITQTCNGDTAMARVQGEQILQYYGNVRTGNFNGLTPPLFGVSAAVWSDYVKVFDSVAYRYNAVQKPTLFIGLEKDFNVPIATELTRFRQQITTGADFYELPGLNHYLCTNNDPAFSQMMSDTIIHWLRKSGIVTSVPVVAAASKGITLKQEGTLLKLVSERHDMQRLIVADMNGRVVLDRKANGREEQLRLSGQVAGMYVLKVLAGKDSATFRVMLQP
jgi:pimeloyl-ACP methyl ester carboxylesterase